MQNEREWSRFCTTVLEQPGIASNSRFDSNKHRVSHRTELDEIIVSVTASLTREQLLKRLIAADVAYGSVNAIADLSAHPALRRRTGLSSTGSPVEFPAGAIQHLGKDSDPSVRAPGIGEHSQKIREEFAEL